MSCTTNKNLTVKWINGLGDNKISFDSGIIDGTKNRGIYGIFIVNKDDKSEYCAYIGRAVDIYSRFLCKDGHFVKLRKQKLNNSKIVEALDDDDKKIEVRVLEYVEFTYESYCKDVQFLASRECHHIDEFQKKNQCLEQFPDGSNIRKEAWDEERKKRYACN